MSNLIISLHFPKAGGSSLGTQLQAIYQEKLLLDYDSDPLSNGANLKVNQLPEAIKIVHGHFPAARYEDLKNSFRFTFLRHPVSNLLSIYTFWQKLPRTNVRLHQQFLDEKPTFKEFASYPPLSHLMSKTYFGNFDMSRMNFVGFHESRENDISNLGRILGICIKTGVHVNKTEECKIRSNIESDVDILRKVSSLLSDDIDFYEKQRVKWGR